ncbi:cytochrome P450 [Synechococcus sp. HB1133]|uniref:cytochrome P450 n=1 Tax=unclassified Synechococcus TaxID=2626047 RepID=UPI00140B3F6E|nr:MULTISPECIES: cytochrome P450 [unclassified Synechococcus]MCB4395226.1 cytochrome P450 [Synechococcus sp. PH41509]MCB4422390.1 cytochrome P450 [Synechococcus sp. HB1133]MCB4429504.1 cytochrome P450 [Synechococcus sp. HBA1120]NHI81334.1 cytochrome P450 [Synechococcus sp. HB1133]
MTTIPLPSTGAMSGLGETLAFFTQADFAQRRFQAYGDVFETKLLAQRMVFIRGERAIADLLGQGDALEGWWPDSVQQLLGSKSLANRNGTGHKARRRVVGQLFSSAALARYTPSIQQLVEELCQELVTAEKPLPLAARMRRFAFAVIATTVLGLDGASRDALFADFEIWTRALFSIPLAIPGTPFAKAVAARQRLLQRIKAELQRDSKAGGLDLLSGGLDEAGIPLDDDDLAEQLLLLLFAGYETTASSLSCLFRALLLNPEIETWLREGLAESVTSPRLDATVLEVMRLTPPVGGFFRRSLAPIALAGVAIPQGSVVQVVLSPASDNDDADLAAFRPQRHLDGSFGQTLLPFGGGERVCLGKALAELEIRLMAVGLLQAVELQLQPDQDLALQLIPSPSPKDGLLVQAAAR